MDYVPVTEARRAEIRAEMLALMSEHGAGVLTGVTPGACGGLALEAAEVLTLLAQADEAARLRAGLEALIPTADRACTNAVVVREQLAAQETELERLRGIVAAVRAEADRLERAEATVEGRKVALHVAALLRHLAEGAGS